MPNAAACSEPEDDATSTHAGLSIAHPHHAAPVHHAVPEDAPTLSAIMMERARRIERAGHAAAAHLVPPRVDSGGSAVVGEPDPWSRLRQGVWQGRVFAQLLSSVRSGEKALCGQSVKSAHMPIKHATRTWATRTQSQTRTWSTHTHTYNKNRWPWARASHACRWWVLACSWRTTCWHRSRCCGACYPRGTWRSRGGSWPWRSPLRSRLGYQCWCHVQPTGAHHSPCVHTATTSDTVSCDVHTNPHL